jgi:hypothetical protein
MVAAFSVTWDETVMFLLRLKRARGVGAFIPLCVELRVSNGAAALRPMPTRQF